MNVENVVNYENEIAMYPDIMENLEYYMNFYGYNDFQIFKTWKEFPPTFPPEISANQIVSHSERTYQAAPKMVIC